jgi:hypothetical protein
MAKIGVTDGDSIRQPDRPRDWFVSYSFRVNRSGMLRSVAREVRMAKIGGPKMGIATEYLQRLARLHREAQAENEERDRVKRQTRIDELKVGIGLTYAQTGGEE